MVTNRREGGGGRTLLTLLGTVYLQTCCLASSLSTAHKISSRGTHLQHSHPSSYGDEVLISPGNMDPAVQILPESLNFLSDSSSSEHSSSSLSKLPSTQSTFHLVDECVKITMEEGMFHFKSRGGGGGVDQVCGLYFIADPDKVINIHVDYLDVQCVDKGLISVVDGWELNGQVFPSPTDHGKDMASRFTDLCVEDETPSNGRRRKVQQRSFFTSGQNAALIQYRVPAAGQGFSVRVRHIHNPTPCNILVQDLEAVYKLENFGRGSLNCSLTTLFDSKIRILYMSTGLLSTPRLRSHCAKLGLDDYVQIGGSSGLDTSKMELVDEFCGHQTKPMEEVTVFCGVTTVRLVSSGKYVNKVILEVRRSDIEDLDNANYICELEK